MSTFAKSWQIWDKACRRHRPSEVKIDVMRIAFLSRSLSAGGAERQLGILAGGMARAGHRITIFTFYGHGADDPRLAGVEIITLGKAGRWHVLTFLARLIVAMRRARPDVIHSYLPTANCIAALIRPFVPGAKLVFGVRSSDMQARRYDRLEQFVYWLERRLARWADLLIANSEAARCHLTSRGYPAGKIAVIPNGIDVAEFHPGDSGRAALRAAWGVAADETAIGVVGRFDPMKDHETFLQAFAQLQPADHRLRAVFVGGGSDDLRRHLQARSHALGVGDRIVWAGPRHDMTAVYNAFDLLCLPSAYGEGFPNVIGEAMACEVPCVATDVGDSAAIVGDLGEIVPRRNAPALAAGLRSMLARPADERRRLGKAARRKVVDDYGVARLVDATLGVIETITR
ncbi:MAG: glycosyltransferase [Proteobacteria bacterium]|nr:glycosyltransferase [Pseudomonadota bacterium]